MKANGPFLFLSVLLLVVTIAACGSSLTEQEEKRLRSITYDMEQNPSDAGLYYIRGDFYLERCMPKQAVEDFTRAIQLSRDSEERLRTSYGFGVPRRQFQQQSYGSRAVAYILIGSDAKANRDQQQALSLASDSYASAMAVHNVKNAFERAQKKAAIDPC